MNEYLAAHLPTEKITEYCARQPILRLSVFGSAAREELRPDSDIDFLVEYLPDAGVGYFSMARHWRELSEIVGRPIDLATPNSLNRHIRQDVLSSARQIYSQTTRK